MYSNDEIRNICAPIVVRGLKARQIPQGGLEWTAAYRAELAAAVRKYSSIFNAAATDEIKNMLTPSFVASLPAPARHDLLLAYQRKDVGAVREIVARFGRATDEGGDAA